MWGMNSEFVSLKLITCQKGKKKKKRVCILRKSMETNCESYELSGCGKLLLKGRNTVSISYSSLEGTTEVGSEWFLYKIIALS